MGEFQRSPSKVWWAEESLSWRAHSASPGSQDSGFSDTETSPQIQAQLAKSASTPKANLTSEIVEKSTPDKCLLAPDASYQPQHDVNKVNKVSRNLFHSGQLEHTKQACGRDVRPNGTPTFDESEEFDGDDVVSSNRTLPGVSRNADNYPPNLSAPAYIFQHQDVEEEETPHLDDDSEGEMETYFCMKSPKHTSTPKLQHKPAVQRLGRVHAMNLLAKYQRVIKQRLDIDTVDEKTSLDYWLKQQKHNYEPECMTTLQCKSIAAELSEKVGHAAAKSSKVLQTILRLHQEITACFDYLKNNKQAHHARLFTLIEEYMNLQPNKQTDNINQLKQQLGAIQGTLNLAKVHKSYLLLHAAVVNGNVQAFVDHLSDPRSEMDVRAKLTALTSLTLRNEALVPVFIGHGAIQAVTALVEKCEGSSVRGLGLRALTTLCTNANSIRQLESVSGLATIANIICDHSRPEPERTEAIALLAQITAPWIEDNHSVHGLHTYSKRLVKHLTRCLEVSTCCQSVLLVTAALANLTAMDTKAIKYLLHQGTVALLLDIAKRHGNVAVYILEQLATLIATMASQPEPRVALCEMCAPMALVCFLQTRHRDESRGVVVRMQQRAVIGLSRLCTERDAAEQVVDAGGVEKLVQLCRDKRERFDNDAVLVAALATLRKITEACGTHVVSEEDAQELIQPKLLDSFKAYSTQNESQV